MSILRHGRFDRSSMNALQLEVLSAESLDAVERSDIIALCQAAYAEDIGRLFELLPGSVHLLARDIAGGLVSHAAWVTRWLQPAGHPPLRTAYIEAVATWPDCQRQGAGTTVMRRVMEVISANPSWALTALSPAVPEWYERLGWEHWRGPLAIRHDDQLEPSPPDEQVMFQRLPGTPRDLDPTALLTAEWREGEVW
jgi:aminoglycoside 2'-N-acetyltransferase I